LTQINGKNARIRDHVFVAAHASRGKVQAAQCIHGFRGAAGRMIAIRAATFGRHADAPKQRAA